MFEQRLRDLYAEIEFLNHQGRAAALIELCSAE